MTRRHTSNGPWGALELDRQAPVPLYVQLRDALVAQVEAGGLVPGSRLPSVRDLARELDLNVNTVARAYRLLEEAGAVETHAAKGTFVRRAPAESPRPIPAVGPGEARRSGLAAPPDVISLAGGTPAPDLFPLEAFRRLLDAVLDEEGPAALQYASVDGDPALRAVAAATLREGGVPAAPDDLLVTTGAQQGIDLVARALLAPGDAVVVEAPTYPGALESFERTGCRLVAVPMTPRGPDLAALPALLERHRPRLVYTVPTFHNPTGWTMDAVCREALVDLGARVGAFVLEDDHLADLRFEGEPLPPLKALDRAGLVVHVRGFAKTIMPGLRLGLLVAPPALRRRLVGLKLAADLYAPPLEQRVLARFLASGAYRAHLERIRPAYRARRDRALAGVAPLAARGLSVTPPAGGLNLWLGLPEGVGAGALEREALAVGVAVAPGGLFYPDRRDGEGFVRLSYGGVTEEVLAQGLARFATALDRALAAAPAPAAVPAAMPIV